MAMELKSWIARVDGEAWLRFFVAVGGLLLAFFAAMFSTLFREQGNLIGTAICASAALLIAGLVAITTVPYLAKRVALERVRSAFEYDITREGAIYLVVGVVIGVAALNTGNNLLFIVIAAMLAAILVSGVVSAGMLRAIRLEVSLPQHIYADVAISGRIALHNARSVAAFSISVIPPKKKKGKHWQWTRSTFSFPPNRPKEKQWLHLQDAVLRRVEEISLDNSIFEKAAYFPLIPGRGSVSANIELLFPRRGRYQQDEFGLATKFPFSFLKKTRRQSLRKEIIVYPSVEPTDEFLEALPTIRGDFETLVAGRGSDLYRIREYNSGDPARHIDWKSTAKSGSLKVREFTREDERKLRVVFDNPAPKMLSAASYESAVRLAASFAWHFADGSTEMRFAGPGYGRSTDIFDFLRYLALVQPSLDPSVLETLETSNEYNLVITARPRGTIPTEIWNSSYILFVGKK